MDTIDDFVITKELIYANGKAIKLKDIDKLYLDWNDSAEEEFKPNNKQSRLLHAPLVGELENQTSDEIFAGVDLLTSEIHQFIDGPNKDYLPQIRQYLHLCLVYIKVLNKVAEREGIKHIFDSLHKLKLPTTYLMQISITNGEGE